MFDFYRVTHLELDGVNVQPFPNFQQLLASFPDLESLKISGFHLEEDHFTAICRYMPKLKVLILLNGNTYNEVCIVKFIKLVIKLIFV